MSESGLLQYCSMIQVQTCMKNQHCGSTFKQSHVTTSRKQRFNSGCSHQLWHTHKIFIMARYRSPNAKEKRNGKCGYYRSLMNLPLMCRLPSSSRTAILVPRLFTNANPSLSSVILALLDMTMSPVMKPDAFTLPAT